MKRFSQTCIHAGLAGLGVLAACGGFELAAFAATSSYQDLSLVSDEPGVGRYTDANLLNPWDMVLGPGGQWIVTDNHTGLVSFYKSNWQPLPQVVHIPAPGGGLAKPTGLGLNKGNRGFMIGNGSVSRASQLLVVTENGTIAGWNPKVNATEAETLVDNSGSGAIYKGMTLFRARGGMQLAAANFGQGQVEIYDSELHLVKSFTEPNLAAAGYVPFGIKVISKRLFVTYAFKASPGDDDETPGPGQGYVVEFDTSGNFKRIFAGQGTLNAPWGLSQAPGGFGTFGGALLVGNFGDGTVNAYNLKTGTFLGQLKRADSSVIHVDGLWALDGSRGGGALYFAAGPDDEEHGLLGVIQRNRPRGGGYGGGGY